MIGKTGIVIETCAPEGLVRIGNEIWKAKSITGAKLEKGREIIVIAQDGLLLNIEPAPVRNRTEIGKTRGFKLKKIIKAAFSNVLFFITVILIAIILIIFRYYIWTKPIIQPVFKIIDGN